MLSDDQDEGEQERHVAAAVCESDDTIKKIAAMQYPTDPFFSWFCVAREDWNMYFSLI